MREPYYSPDVELILSGLERGSDSRLLDAVCDAVNLICDQGDSANAQAEMLITKVAGPVFGKHSFRTADMNGVCCGSRKRPWHLFTLLVNFRIICG